MSSAALSAQHSLLANAKEGHICRKELYDADKRLEET